ncbi:sacsin-like isoform X1 [Mya arenaria]|uniref:sacsin-like isoform X1 n=1 Tax=Mya arenaria TaxID=6604 RepID=UPI0022E554DB|nr:sacsin-like isoform X1 [Mya arenaria]
MAFVGGGAAVRRQPLFSAMKQPSLIKQLRGILAEYPDGGQILKELIQNAEDAGAREVKILFDAGSTSRDAVDQEPEFTKFFQTPALCVYNDAVFTDQDWEGIKMIYSSIKEEDKSKVGRFGLGFKSVFHITDYPCIISGDQMLLIDPQKPPERVNARFEIPGLHDPWEGLDMNDFYKGLGGHFGIDHSMINDGRYSGTLFWFPLRKRPSPLSENLYDERKILDLFDGLKSEAPSILIFLRSLESLSIYTATENDHSTKVLKSQKKKHLSLHVSIKNAKDHVRQSREKFYAKMETNRSDVASMTDYCIEITDKARVTDHHWVVLNYFAGNFASERFQTLIDDKDLSMSPCVSIAVSLDRINQPFEGHIYCFMPLPKEGSKLTGLSFHVNGFFALSQNRHHMKWVTDEQKMQKVFDKNVLWNQYMVNEALPKAFQVIYLSLVRRAKQNGNSITDVMNVYRLLPNVNNVLDKWRKFIYNALSLVKPEKILFCRDLNDWISLQKSVFASFDNLPRHLEHVRSSVKECLKCMGHYLVEVPHEIVSTFKLIFPRQVTDVTPMLLAGYMRQNIKYIELDDKTKFNILDYLVSDGDSTKLESLHLILLASREWAAFSQQGKPIYICNENIVSLFPWMANRFLAPDAHSTSTETFCVSGLFQLREFTDSEMKTFLQKTMSKNLDITSTVSKTSPINIQWLEKVWRVIGGNIDKFASLPLVPYLQSGRFLSRYTVKLIPLSTPFLVVAACRGATVPNELVRPLNLLGMTVLPDVPPFVHQYAAHILKWPYTEKLVQILNGIAASSNQWSFIDKFNKSSSNEDKVALFKFLTRSSTLNEHGKSFITSLNIFPVVHDGIMNTSFGDLRAVNSFVEQSVLDNVPRNVPLPYPCVLGEDQQGRFLQTLGLKELTLEIFFEEKLTIMSAKGFTEETKLTMISFLSNIQLFKRNYRLLGLAAFIPFLLKGKVRVKASDLFDSLDRNVERLFVGQDNLYENKNELNKSHDELKMIGLKGYNDISVDEIYTVAKTLDSWSRNNNHLDDIVEKAKAFQEYIEKHPEILQKGLRSGKKTFGEAILNLQCFTNFKEMFDGADELCKQSFSLSMPSNLKLTHHWKLVCLVRPVVETHCRCLAMFYQWHEQPSVDDVLENLNRVKTVMTRGQYVQTLRLMVAEAFQYLHKKLKESIDRRQTFVQNALVWTEEGFCVPDKAILLREDVSSINFSPYFKFIPREFKYMRDLFVGIGCNLTEDKHVLAHFLHDIRKTYLKRVLATNTEFDRARVVSALDRLASKDIDKDWLKENVIVLIDSPENQIKFASITDCVYDDEPEMFDETCTEEAKLKQVHPSLSKQTVVKLGVKSVAHRTLLDAEDIGFEEWGQREKLTDRLNKLLTNGYTDGLSVPKELIQNADDAHATEVSFLYDERRNDDAKKRLFSKQLDECQGPALWVHNNAVFSANDLRNITKLNGETKTSKTTIGKFGLGFCSVYNLTDVPSFISGKNLVMFDPNETYIQEVRARPSTGIKVPLSKRLIIRRHEDQFKPFEGVFGCKVLDESFQSYDNTLFRLPLRTSHQAGVSKISRKVYSREEVKELLTMIMKTAGNHLLFCQNVKKVNIYHLVDGKSPSESRLCFTVQKSLLTCQHIGTNIVEQAENLFARKVNLSSNQTIRIRQQCLTIDLWTKSKQRQYENETDWIVTWYMSSDIKYQSGHLKSMLPLTAIASPVDIGRKNAMFLKDLPFGFYKEGHLFCFLPLPVTSGLQVHINGFFSVTSDRRGLSLANEDDKSNKLDIHWNKALLTTSAVKAFTCHLLSIITTCDIVDIYSLFPEECKEIVTSFVSSFYQNIVQCNSKLFKGESQYYSFNEIQMLDESVCHEKALLEVIYNMLNGIQRNDMKVVVKIPNFVLRKLLKYNATELEKVNQSVISMTHVMKIFLQTITSTYWMGKDDQRNLLLQHTVIHGNNEIRQMLKEIPCFPTEPWGLLRKITELVSPSSTIAKLFRVSDERFISNNSGLRQEYFVSKLVDLGMQEKFLSPLLLLDRCLSISKYIEECTECCKMQIQRVLRYLLSLHDIKELEKSHEIEKIRQTPFLPVLSKPKDWVFSWNADASNKLIIGKDITCQNHTYTSNPPIVIGNPMDLFSFDRSYIGSVQFIYNESFSSQVRLPPAMKMLLNIRDKVSVGILLEQLGCLADEASTLNQYFNKMTQHICDSVYESLDALIINMEDNCFQKLAMEMCAEILTKPIILIGKDLVCPKNVALNMKTSSPPDLYCPQNLPLSQLRVFQKFGMKTHFRVVDIVHVLNEKKMKWYGKPCLEIQNILNLLVNLEDCMTTEGKSYDDFEEFHDIIIAPDVNKYLHPTFMLAVEDVDIVSLEGLLLMHGDISQNLAKSVGVKTKKIQFMQRISTVIPFGQCEKLTTRLNGLLKDYPCDESIMKELIQNSDDAGATEIHFIKFYGGNDERESLEHHGQNLPALCVYNDSYFREGDFKGIKNLGEGSKSNDPTKTGQFGVGFNAVYHLTDCPSFITKGPDMPSGGELVMFDPLLRYIGEYSGNEYGIRVEMKHLLEQYPGTLSNYPPLKGQVGTMFRLPLRTDGSPISNHVLTEQQLDILFEKFTQAAGNCLHFLKNIKCIKFMTCFNNDLKKLFSVETQMSQTDTKKRSSFFRKVHSTCLQHENKLQNTRIEQFSTTYKMVIKNSKGNAIPWLIVQNFGIKQNEREIDPHITKAFDEGELGLLPLGGVSMQLCETDPRAYITSHIDQHKTPSDPKHEAFAGIAYCFLPLPVNTGMPFNINGHFALDRGRRSLWDEGYRKSWNEYILKKIISEALKSALVYMQKYWVENYKDLMTNTIAIRVCLSLYYNNWPRYASAKDDDWKYFVKAFYGKVFSSQYTIFALPNRTEIPNKQKKRKVQCAIQWVGPARNNTDTTGGIFNIVYQYISRANMFTRENAKDVELTIARLGWQLISKVPSDILETLTLTECTEAVYTDPKFLLTVIKQENRYDLPLTDTVYKTPQLLQVCSGLCGSKRHLKKKLLHYLLVCLMTIL